MHDDPFLEELQTSSVTLGKLVSKHNKLVLVMVINYYAIA
jgi:hypothetical protein